MFWEKLFNGLLGYGAANPKPTLVWTHSHTRMDMFCRMGERGEVANGTPFLEGLVHLGLGAWAPRRKDVAVEGAEGYRERGPRGFHCQPNGGRSHWLDLKVSAG